MDTTAMGQIAAEAMGVIAKDYEDYPDAKLEQVVIVAEVTHTDEDGDKIGSVGTASTTDSRVYQTGILMWGLDMVKDNGVPAHEGDE